MGSLAIWLVLLFGATLRVLNLLSDKAFWNDELFSVLLARKPFWDVLYGVISDVHPPGHLILLHVFYSLLGDIPWAYRLLSVITGCLLIGLVYLFAPEFFDKRKAVLASFLVAVSPYFIQLSNEARSYSLITLAITFTSYAFLKSFRTSDSKWRRAYLVSAILCVYINHFAWLWLFMTNVFLLLNKRFIEFLRSHLQISFYGLPALILTIYQALFSPESLAPHIQRSFTIFPIVKKIFAVLWHAATGYGYSGWSKETLPIYSSEPLFWLAVFAYVSFLIAVLYSMIKARKDVLLFLCLTSVIPIVLLCILYPTRLESRYVSFSVPPLIIFAAAGFQQLKYRWIWLSPIIVLSLYFTFKTLAMPWDPIHREDYRVAIRYTFKTAGENDAVCGMDRQVQYYGPQKIRARYYFNVKKADLKVNRYKKIFLLEPPLYVSPEKDRTRLDFSKNLLQEYGYVLTESINFGNANDNIYAFVHVFEKKT